MTCKLYFAGPRLTFGYILGRIFDDVSSSLLRAIKHVRIGLSVERRQDVWSNVVSAA